MSEKTSMKPDPFEPIRKNNFIFEVAKFDPFLVKEMSYDPISKHIVASFYESAGNDVVGGAVKLHEKGKEFSCVLKVLNPVGQIIKKITFKKCKVQNIKTSGFQYASDNFCETLLILGYESVQLHKKANEKIPTIITTKSSKYTDSPAIGKATHKAIEV